MIYILDSYWPDISDYPLCTQTTSHVKQNNNMGSFLTQDSLRVYFWGSFSKARQTEGNTAIKTTGITYKLCVLYKKLKMFAKLKTKT